MPRNEAACAAAAAVLVSPWTITARRELIRQLIDDRGELLAPTHPTDAVEFDLGRRKIVVGEEGIGQRLVVVLARVDYERALAERADHAGELDDLRSRPEHDCGASVADR
jgi:hypothetical protein